MRPLISYEDIASTPPNAEVNATDTKGSGVDTNKNPSQANSRQRAVPKHRDEPDTAEAVMSYHSTPTTDPTTSGKKRKRESNGWKQKSRPLTHEEIWDDSALIEAWDSAMEEYEMMNGDKTSWKGPIHKSALWYNEPEATEEVFDDDENELGDETVEDQEEEENSHPIDFETFIPTHNPALSQVAGLPSRLGSAPAIDLASISKGDAFHYAVQASYWAGYWTAIYHSKGGDATDAVKSNRSAHDGEIADATQEEDQIVVDKLLPAEREE